jgi:hypothetical protein
LECGTFRATSVRRTAKGTSAFSANCVSGALIVLQPDAPGLAVGFMGEVIAIIADVLPPLVKLPRPLSHRLVTFPTVTVLLTRVTRILRIEMSTLASTEKVRCDCQCVNKWVTFLFGRRLSPHRL